MTAPPAPAERRPETAAATIPAALASVAWRTVAPLAAVVALGFGALYFVVILARPLAFLILAVTIAEALSPVVDRLERRMPRGLAIALVFLALLGLFVGIVAIAAPSVAEQTRRLTEQGPQLLERGQRWLEQQPLFPGGDTSQQLTSRIGQLGGAALGVPLKLFSWTLEIVLVLFLAIYWLAGKRSMRRFLLSLFPESRREHAGAVLAEMGHAMGGYVRVVAFNAVVVGLMSWLGLTLIGVDFALLLGILSMLGEPIPIVGPIITAIPAVALALLESPTKALLVAGLYLVIQQVEGQILTPNVMKREVHMPQTLVLFALAAGAAAGGLLGAIVSLPLAGALQVLTVRVLAPAVRRMTGAPPLEPEPGT
jgi:predicted PurR-regulated permease PerM